MTRITFLLSAAFIFMAPSAMAQTYGISSQMSGDPQSSAQFGDDPLGFADYSPAQIAADVTTQFNPRTGAREYVAPTFDPFELDDDLAGTVSLRSTDGARDLNNDPLQGGALLDISLFYTDDGQRQFGLTRDAVFLNGAPVPITLRDGRELECSARVTERVYRYERHNDGYRGSPYWTRPDYYGYGGYGPYGGYGVLRPSRRPVSRPGPRPRPRPRPTPRPRPDAGPRVDDSGQGRPRGRADYFINGRKAGTKPQPERRPRRPRGDTGSNSGTFVSPDVRVTPTSPRVRPQPETRRRPVTRPDRRREPRPEPRPDRRPERSVVTPPSKPKVRPRPTPRPKPAPKPDRKPRVDPVSKPRPRTNPSDRTPTRYDMFPGDGYDGAVVVSSQRDCAREDQLTLFISDERLDAARFDGLTIVVRDVTFDPRTGQTTVYDERPLYLPPNYIEGFRLAQRQP